MVDLTLVLRVLFAKDAWIENLHNIDSNLAKSGLFFREDEFYL